MKHLKRILALIAALALVLSLLGCSKGGSGSGDPGNTTPEDTQSAMEKKLKGVEKVKLDHVYKVEYLDVKPDGSSYINSIREAAGSIYLTSNFDREIPSQTNPGETEHVWGVELFRLDPSGKLEKLLSFQNESEYDEANSRSTESYVNNINVAPDGTIWYLKEQYLNDWSDPENYVWEQSSSLVHADTAGQELLSIPLDSLKDPKAEDEYLYIQNMCFAGNGNILAQTGNGFIGLDPEGKVLFRGESMENTYVQSLYVTGSGRIIGYFYSYNPTDYSNTMSIREVDPNSGKTTELGSMGGASVQNITNLYGGPGDTLILGKNTGIDSYDLTTNTRTEILNWLNCDVNANYVNNVVPLADGRFFLVERNWRQGNDNLKMAYMTPVGETVEKYLIHFAAMYLDDNVTNSIISYNKQNDMFRIVFDDYSVYNTEDDYEAGLKILNQEIISGKIPDLFSMVGLPYDVYASKGLLLDLKPRLDADPDFRMEDYLENVFKAVERDGKICSIIPAFSVQPLVAKASLVGNKSGWTMEELANVLKAHPDMVPFSDTTRESALNILLANNMDAFVDPATGACSFNSPACLQLLELVKTFPEEIDWEKLYNDDPMYWEKQQSQYREGRTLLMQQYLSSYTDIRNIFYQFDSDCTFIGLPGAKGTGAVISPQMEIAISGRTKLDDQCWDFLRYLLSAEYQNDMESWCFPVRLDALEAMAQNAMEESNNGGPILYTTGNGGGMIYEESAATEAMPAAEAEPAEEAEPAGDASEGTATAGDLEPEYPIEEPVPGYDDWWSKPITQEMADMITDTIKGAVQVTRSQEEIMAIIMEEAGAFFAGQKTAQAVADVIQSRVSLYVMESR